MTFATGPLRGPSIERHKDMKMERRNAPNPKRLRNAKGKRNNQLPINEAQARAAENSRLKGWKIDGRPER